MERRTRLGKVVGSYKPPLDGFTYWQEGGKFVVVAPSGARLTTHADEVDAMLDAAERQREWDALGA